MLPNERRSPVRARRAPLRNDFRSILRSRGVQVLLLATVAAQTLSALSGRTQGTDPTPRRGVVVTAMQDAAQKLTPVLAQPPVGPSPVQLTAAQVREAERLAQAYRRKGYTVPERLARDIYSAAVANQLDPAMAFGLVRTESDFKNNATSHVGAIGLTQLMLPTARWFKRDITVRELRDSRTNLRIGFRYLAELVDRYDGDLELALTAYNRGSGVVDRVLARGGDPDNGYADLVLRR